jgi:1,4-dihydroxy-2-naphthoyl-CoA hydrolase
MSDQQSIFRKDFTLDSIKEMGKGTLAEALNINLIEIGPDYLKATMPVDSRTRQSMGILHGGASVALAETAGSVAGYGTVDPIKQYCVGLEINANHLRSKASGIVTADCRPIHLGRKTQVWDIRITDENHKLICISRLTLAVLDR